MVNKYLLVAFLAVANLFGAYAQVDSKYLTGAMPEVNGRVVITREIKLPADKTQQDIFSLVEEWANQEYAKDEQQSLIRRVLLSSPEEYYVACQGDDYLVFRSSALVLDRAKMYYQLIVRAEKNKCTLEFRNIKYNYQDYDGDVPAEEMITDKVALNKEGTKLSRYYDKFRTFSIDRVDEIAENLRTFFVNKMVDTSVASVSESKTISTTTIAATTVGGSQAVPVAKQEQMADFNYKLMSIEELSGDIMAMFKENWALVIANVGSEIKTLPAAWSGVGNFGGKAVAMSVARTDNNTVDTYTISFYTPIHKGELDKIEKGQSSNLTPITTPSGASAFSEAWMIIECKKVLDQSVTDAMLEGLQSKAWSKVDFDKLLMGEIINIWAR